MRFKVDWWTSIITIESKRSWFELEYMHYEVMLDNFMMNWKEYLYIGISVYNCIFVDIWIVNEVNR